MKIELKAYAKINLFLEIVCKRDDGFHELVTVMQEVDIFDDLSFEEIKEDCISIICNDSTIPINNGNLIWKAADLFRNRFKIRNGVRIHLEKRIPVGAGLGGGSSDAATTFKGLNALWHKECDDIELMEMAGEIGSDIPFFIKGNTAVCRGRGEVVTEVSVNKDYVYVIVYPNLKISTASIYKNLKLGLTKEMKDVNFFLKQLADNDHVMVGNALFNRLDKTIYRLHPDLLELKKTLEGFNFCGVQISGSGSALFGLCERRRDAEDVKKELSVLGSAKVFVAANIRN
ncbi:MAG: 4-(cytidine 5'-diphospho)-2-C-methyl-D-erythritol kinase [Candidatus Anammoxibacter sp.]